MYLFYSHPVLSVHLLCLFILIPDASGHSVVIPLLKNPDGNQFTSDNNYRAITVSPAISKLFEMAIMMALLDDKLDSDPVQFDFKRNARLMGRTVVNRYVKDGFTVNTLALDLSKPFDRVGHFALLQLLMDRHISRHYWCDA